MQSVRLRFNDATKELKLEMMIEKGKIYYAITWIMQQELKLEMMIKKEKYTT